MPQIPRTAAEYTRSVAAVRLEQWLAEHEVTAMGFAAALGSSKAAMSYYLSGIRTPKLDLATKIEQLTGIAVDDWRQPAEYSGGLEALLAREAQLQEELRLVRAEIRRLRREA